MNFFLVSVLVLIASCFFTGVLRSYALARSMLDIPNARSSHLIPTPRGGGLAIVLTFLISACCLWLLGKIPVRAFMALLGGGVLVAGVGFLDDCGHVSARLRLLIHFAAAGLALFWIGGAPSIQIGEINFSAGFFGDILTLILLVWTLNLYNFMDGIDGIAAVEAISIAGGAAGIIFLLHGADSDFSLLILLAMGCTGFLVWNWPPARIFMGDVGSGFLGYTLGVLAILTASSGLLSIWAWLILFGVFYTDATVTLLRRLLRGERWYEAHCSHAYQCAARRYQSHKKVTLSVLAINACWLFPLAMFAGFRPDLGLLLTVLALTPLVVLAVKMTDEKWT